MKLRLAPTTERFVTTYGRSLPHATLISGPVGVGLGTLAGHLAESNGQMLAHIRPEQKTSTSLRAISVERIRHLYIETRTRLSGPHFVIIDDADTMNHVAQNALLKLLEEPNESVHFILTSHKPDGLLPTIRSRVAPFVVPPISTIESRRLLKSAGVTDGLTEQRLLYVSDGLPAELSRLASDGSDFKALSEMVQRARQFVEGSAYERLTVVQATKDDRHASLKLIDTILMLLRRSLQANADRSTIHLIEKLVRASEAIRANGNIKLHLSDAVLQ